MLDTGYSMLDSDKRCPIPLSSILHPVSAVGTMTIRITPTLQTEWK